MALYWPGKRVALDIVDGPNHSQLKDTSDYTVVETTTTELEQASMRERIDGMLRALLGTADTDVTDEDSPFEVTPIYPYTKSEGLDIVASSDEEGEAMRCAALERGESVSSVSVWHGPVPAGSFSYYSPGVRMSTAEYFFLRRANNLSLPQAVRLAIELCGKFRSEISEGEPGSYEFLRIPRTDITCIRDYLNQIADTVEGKRALKALSYVAEGCSSPVASFLYLMLTLPAEHGGYNLPRPAFSSVFKDERGFMPGSKGDYLAYDLCWEDEHVAVEYIEDSVPTLTDLEALMAGGMQVVCVSREELQDPLAIGHIATCVAKLLGEELPLETSAWLEAQKDLRASIEVPPYHHMRCTFEDLRLHIGSL